MFLHTYPLSFLRRLHIRTPLYNTDDEFVFILLRSLYACNSQYFGPTGDNNQVIWPVTFAHPDCCTIWEKIKWNSRSLWPIYEFEHFIESHLHPPVRRKPKSNRTRTARCPQIPTDLNKSHPRWFHAVLRCLAILKLISNAKKAPTCTIDKI